MKERKLCLLSGGGDGDGLGGFRAARLWLGKLNPEVALIMFGTNDLGQLDLEEYEAKTRRVVEKCLSNGTIVILSTIPPKHGQAEKVTRFLGVTGHESAELMAQVITMYDFDTILTMCNPTPKRKPYREMLLKTAIVGMKSLEQLQINVAGARRQPLDEQQRRALEAAMGGPASGGRPG